MRSISNIEKKNQMIAKIRSKGLQQHTNLLLFRTFLGNGEVLQSVEKKFALYSFFRRFINTNLDKLKPTKPD